MVQATIQRSFVCAKSIGNASTQCEEKYDIDNEKYLADGPQPGEAIRLLAKKSRNSTSTHRTFEL